MKPIPVLELPRIIPPARERRPQENVPQTRGEREKIKEVVTAYVERVRPVPPLSIAELKTHAESLIDQHGFDGRYLD
jgi:geranylgeranyl diphosphate synthase, type II